MALSDAFFESFKTLAGHEPFPWQERLFKRFTASADEGDIPKVADIPTGLGKTSVIAVWLLALMESPRCIPRRLVYVVNRRTVVDQTTVEVERLRANLPKLGRADFNELAISTLRGQFADNREWSADPSRPAVICGTVDMIGSRLLFGGYGVGFKARPLHGGFLGQDVLLVHDEAHLEPAFQRLIEKISSEQERCKEFAKFRVMELTATTRSDQSRAVEDEEHEREQTFELTDEETNPPESVPEPIDGEPPIHVVWRRLRATKHLCLNPTDDEKHAPGQIATIADGYKNDNAAVLVFVRTLEAVEVVKKELAKSNRSIVLLTGTVRGKERDDLVKQPVFRRFLKGSASGETVYLVCTSAGEVGVDISADHMVCDLSTFESMAQRFGRVNRYGARADTRIDVVHPLSFGHKDKKSGELKADELDKRRQKTLELLGKLAGDASPLALGKLDAVERLAAFAPPPTILPVTDILFDAWALTSVREKMPGRPPVEPYLHGIRGWQPPETQVAWREEVGVVVVGESLAAYPPEDLLEEYPLKPHELLRDRTDRVFKELATLAERRSESPVWIVDGQGTVDVCTLGTLAKFDKKSVDTRLGGATVILPHDVGGLTAEGMLDGGAPPLPINNDVADALTDETGLPFRLRIRDDDEDFAAKTAGMRLLLRIDFPSPQEDGDAAPPSWSWYERPSPSENSKNSLWPVLLDVHAGDVERRATDIVEHLPLDAWIKRAVIVAARFHDLGKRRELWQRGIGRPRDQADRWYAKSGRGWRPRDVTKYRHEFGSLIDVQAEVEFISLDDNSKDLVLHLIAAHHGQGRPHFTAEQAFDKASATQEREAIAVEVPRRFARLQRKFGRWGLAYLESLLRAADWAASAEPSAFDRKSEGPV